MAYIAGSATSCSNLINQISTFLTSNGWILDKQASYNSDKEASIVVHSPNHPSTFIEIARAWVNTYDSSYYQFITMRTSTSFSSSAAVLKQPQGPYFKASYSGSTMVYKAACAQFFLDSAVPAIKFWCFADVDTPYIWLVLTFNAAQDAYCFVGGGKINKIGWSDDNAGQFQTGSCAINVYNDSSIDYSGGGTMDGNKMAGDKGAPFGSGDRQGGSYGQGGAINVTSDDTTSWAMANNLGNYGSASSYFANYSKYFTSSVMSVDQQVQAGLPNYSAQTDYKSRKEHITGSCISQFSGTTPLLPIYLYIERLPKGCKKYSLFGTGPDIFWTNVTNLPIGVPFTQGTDTFVAFPIISKNPLKNEWPANPSYGNWYYGMSAACGNNGFAIKVKA